MSPGRDLHAPTLPLWALHVLSACAATRRARRQRGETEVKLVFVDVEKEAHRNARCGEDAAVRIELLEECSHCGNTADCAA